MKQPTTNNARTDGRRSLGQRGEDYVAATLCRAGYSILARNWRHPELGELDIIAQQGAVIVFVEVRTRRGPLAQAVEQALASVGPRKQARLAQLALAYLAAHEAEGCEWRVDVAAVGCEGDRFALEVIHHALSW